MLWLTYGSVEGRETGEAAGQGGVGLEKDEYNPITTIVTLSWFLIGSP